MNSIILNYDYELELLQDILQEPSHIPTDLVICSPKGDFLEQLLVQLDQLRVRPEVQTPPLQEEVNTQSDERLPEPKRILLSHTLHVLSASQFVNLVFCPSIPILRGYLSGYVSRSVAPSTQPPGPIIILNLLAMHHGTSEFTLQGLSQTLATAVSAGYRTNRVLKLVECKDINDPLNPNRGPRLWQAEVQLLSAAVKIGEPGQSWGRRTISVMRIASRWFRAEEQHERNRQEHNPVVHARNSPDEEMLV
ncbi:uncharacterized protein Z520_00490 [Fonsecaea multimorphosa CBS 102226]|uniref:Uncharacterized protein n=1 Tax=Fonsecaea multimorphosa CBS 102226 TaxID=1442371 RepID=A0A0D2L3Z9_9EURO|nr:uncharacterized protein Z520_00490 [Fonsecaea multimorphosa CBS 102226]KIY03799.1 hypothetical protein Z520_00490 [Fonsecaea multimorphosa CBS 102226]OAL32491.1 hypothetical protein AYO22_00513 [Fonsecaea multimorphosa]